MNAMRSSGVCSGVSESWAKPSVDEQTIVKAKWSAMIRMVGLKWNCRNGRSMGWTASFYRTHFQLEKNYAVAIHRQVKVHPA